MLKRIKIVNYKSFKTLEVSLTPICIIFGPNASGKSNFLDAIYLLSRFITAKNLKEAFEGHRGLPLESFCYADEGYEKLLEEQQIKMSFEVDVELSELVRQNVNKLIMEKRRGIETDGVEKRVVTERYLRYQLTIEGLPKSGYLRVIDERLAALKANGQEKKRFPFLERGQRKDGQAAIRLRLEGQAHPMYHDIGLDHTVISTALYEPHYPHVTAFKMEMENWQVFYLEPKTLMREEVPLADVRRIGPRGENLAAFLNTLKQQDQNAFDNFGLTLQAILPSATRVDVDLLKEGRLGLRLWENGVSYSARLLSEGTLRILGLLAALHPKNSAMLIGYEEPENGVHPVRLEVIAKLLKNAATEYHKQVIVTTHSPVFPRYFEDNSLFVCAKEGPYTMITPFETLGPLFRGRDIEHALEDRILRGDFGG